MPVEFLWYKALLGFFEEGQYPHSAAPVMSFTLSASCEVWWEWEANKIDLSILRHNKCFQALWYYILVRQLLLASHKTQDSYIWYMREADKKSLSYSWVSYRKIFHQWSVYIIVCQLLFCIFSLWLSLGVLLDVKKTMVHNDFLERISIPPTEYGGSECPRDEEGLKRVYCVVPGNIHASPTEGNWNVQGVGRVWGGYIV